MKILCVILLAALMACNTKSKEDVITEKATDYLKTQLKDASSFELISAGVLDTSRDKQADTIYFIRVRIKYRAKNGFGALDVEQKDVRYIPGSDSYELN